MMHGRRATRTDVSESRCFAANTMLARPSVYKRFRFPLIEIRSLDRLSKMQGE